MKKPPRTPQAPSAFPAFLSILLGSAGVHTGQVAALGVTMLHGHVSGETEKAVALTVSGGRYNGWTVWLPKRAVVQRDNIYRLAHWFRPDARLSRILDACEPGVVTSG